MVFMPRVNDPDWTTLQYSINDRITEDLDKYIFTIQNSLQNCVNVMITMLWNLSKFIVWRIQEYITAHSYHKEY